MKYFKSLRQLKYVIILVAVMCLIFLEVCYVAFLGHTYLNFVIDMVVGTMMIVGFAEVAFYFGEQYQNELKQEIEERQAVEEELLLRSSALEAAANAIAITDNNGRFLWANPAFTELTGYSVSELIGHTHAILRSGYHDDLFYKNLWQTVNTGQVWQGEMVNRHKNGSFYTEEQIITPVLNEKGHVTNFIAIKHDISKRKKAEETLQQHTERLRLIHAIDQAILSRQNPTEIAQVALEFVTQIIPCNRASVAVLDEFKHEGTVLAVIQEGETAIPSGYIFPMSEIEKQNLESPETALPIRVVEIKNPHTSTGKQVKAEGITAQIKIPLIAQNKLIGFFNLGAKQKDTFTEEYIAIAQEISISLAIGLQQARFYLVERHQREQAEALREIGEALNATLNFDEILDLLLGQVSRAIPYDSANIILIEGDNAQIHYAHGYERYGEEVAQKVSNFSFKISETPNLHWIIENQETLIIPDIYQYEGWRKDKGITQTRSWVGVPIFVNGTISILFALSKQQPNYYDESHVNTLRAFASQVGLALENARLYEKQRAYANELEDRVRVRTRALADANERLKELDRLKTKFISDVSHELRTPITTVGMYLDLLERGQAHKQQHYMTILKRETRRLSLLIEDIFDESQYASHLRQAKYELVDINEIIYHSIRLHQREAAESDLVITYDLQANISPIWGESLQLTRVVSNLLKNAINYTVKGEICISTHQKEGVITVSMDDTGVGISPEDLPHLFERFYRGKNASQSTIPGTGLGLGVVREIIELHGGTVKASNNDNGGASFQIILPISASVESQLPTGQPHQPQIDNATFLVNRL